MDARIAGHRDRVLLVVVAVVGVGVLLGVDAVATAGSGGFATAEPWYPIGFLVAMGGLAAAGLAVEVRRGDGGTALLLIGTAALGTTQDLLGALQGPGPAAFLQGPVDALYLAVYAHLLLRYPEHRVRSTIGRILLGVLYAGMPALSLLWQLTWDARWSGSVARGWWWPTVVPARGFSASVWDTQQLVLILLIVALVGVLVARVVSARGRLRRALAPVAVAAVLLALTTALTVVEVLGPSLGAAPGILQLVALLVVPAAVGISLVGGDPDGDPAVPIARLHRVQERYRLGLAAGAGVVALLVVVSLVTARASGPVSGPAPAPGPALVADR